MPPLERKRRRDERTRKAWERLKAWRAAIKPIGGFQFSSFMSKAELEAEIAAHRKERDRDRAFF